MAKIVIDSFQWWLSNDKNVGQKWAFWNSKNIEVRRNSAYVELSRWSTEIYIIPSTAWVPTFIVPWGNVGTIAGDMLTFTYNWKVYNSTGSTFVSWFSSKFINYIEANGHKWIIWSDYLHEFSSASSITERVIAWWTSVDQRPAINFFWDLIIGNWTSVLRYNKDGSLITYSSSSEQPVIGWLDWNVVSITNIWPNIYVWCADWGNTNLYIWDWVSPRATQKIRYSDKNVKNVANLGNTHYWWTKKSTYWLRSVLIGDSYIPQEYIVSSFPSYPITTDSESNRNVIEDSWLWFVNDIETLNNIVYFPWQGNIFSFGSYFPWQKFSFVRENTFSWTNLYAFYTWGITAGSKEISSLLFYVYNDWLWWVNPYHVSYINKWQVSNTWATLAYESSWEIETLEYVAGTSQWEDGVKILVPFELSTWNSIKVYVKMDRAASYTLLKTITTTDYSTWYQIAEVMTSWKWKTIQFKFELLTTDTSTSPKLYTWITNESTTVWKIASNSR